MVALKIYRSLTLAKACVSRSLCSNPGFDPNAVPFFCCAKERDKLRFPHWYSGKEREHFSDIFNDSDLLRIESALFVEREP